MKKLLVVAIILLFITACSKNDKDQAINELLKDSKHTFTIHAFSNKSFDEKFKESVQENINKINNQALADSPITTFSFIDVTDNNKYDYEKIFDFDVYPQILVFMNKEIVLKTTNPNELYSYFINQDSE